VLIETLMKERVVTVRPDTSIRRALVAMAEAGVRHLPVVDGAARLVGLVSQIDVVRAMDLLLTAQGERGEMQVRDVMSAPVFRAGRRMPAHEALALLMEHKIGALPIVDGDGRVIGIVSETDFLEVAREALEHINIERRARA
jgi:CBS domain-containing protein